MQSIRSFLYSVRLILMSVGSSPLATTAWGVALSTTFLVYDRIIAGDRMESLFQVHSADEPLSQTSYSFFDGRLDFT